MTTAVSVRIVVCVVRLFVAIVVKNELSTSHPTTNEWCRSSARRSARAPSNDAEAANVADQCSYSSLETCTGAKDRSDDIMFDRDNVEFEAMSLEARGFDRLGVCLRNSSSRALFGC